MQKEKTKVKKWVGWFRPKGRGTKHGSLIAVPIDLVDERSSHLGARKINDETGAPKLFGRNRRDGLKLLVVSVPSSCGNAVQRNRFRRIVKARFAKCFTGQKIVGEKTVSPGGEPPNKSFSSEASRKGLWIRLLNRHRLGRKIQLEEWRKEFDEIESLYCSSKASL